ncbi:MAG: transposase [Verrucomicrobia bacterium]|nr:transposase [Verrucomicrobiota bacterium]
MVNRRNSLGIRPNRSLPRNPVKCRRWKTYRKESIYLTHFRSGKLNLYSMTVMPDHLHLIARWNHGLSLGRTIQSFKGIIAKRHAIEWQQGFFDHRIRSSGELRAKTAYVRANPIRAGLVKTEADWPFAYLCGDDNG